MTPAMDQASAPSAARLMTVLGVLGLVPFIIPPLLRPEIFEPQLSWSSLQAVYAAVILAFLGGARAAQAAFSASVDPRALIISMIPPLAGFALASSAFAVQSAPAETARVLLCLALAMALQGAWDITAEALPPWYRRLRLPLTVTACLALVAGAALAGWRA